MKIPLDIIGNIAILKFPRNAKKSQKIKYAKKLLKQPNITTILEKTDKIKGRLRIAKTSYLAGEKTKETIYKENECRFLINVDETYFSPRLSNHRKEIAEDIARKIKNNSRILVMFGGIAPLPIVIAKILKQKNKLNNIKIISNELNRKANKYAEKNIKLNKFQDNILIMGGDAKKLPDKLKEKFDFILMPRPNLKETFLKTALKLSKKSAIIYYHGFGTKEGVINEIKQNTNNKISKIKIQKAGEIAPYKYRWLAVFKVK